MTRRSKMKLSRLKAYVRLFELGYVTELSWDGLKQFNHEYETSTDEYDD